MIPSGSTLRRGSGKQNRKGDDNFMGQKKSIVNKS